VREVLGLLYQDALRPAYTLERSVVFEVKGLSEFFSQKSEAFQDFRDRCPAPSAPDHDFHPRGSYA
jgi:hypothetical protein